MNTAEIIDEILPSIPYYGEFNLDILLVNITLKDKQGIPYGNKRVDGIIRSSIYNFLVSNGYAVKRNDIIPSGTFLELTERGRWLKEQGSIESYREYQAHKKSLKVENENRLAKVERAQLRMVTLTKIVAFGTSVAAIYYLIEVWKFFSHCVCK